MKYLEMVSSEGHRSMVVLGDNNWFLAEMADGSAQLLNPDGAVVTAEGFSLVLSYAEIKNQLNPNSIAAIKARYRPVEFVRNRDWVKGMFHVFATNSTGEMVGLVEDDEGKVFEIEPEDIRFTDTSTILHPSEDFSDDEHLKGL